MQRGVFTARAATSECWLPVEVVFGWSAVQEIFRLSKSNSGEVGSGTCNMSRMVIVRSARNVLGSLRVPGDKSISHRYAMLAALAQGRSKFENYSPGADCASTLGCMRSLGCVVERSEDGSVVIEGRGAQLKSPVAALDCGNSGSTMRMLSGIVRGPELL